MNWSLSRQQKPNGRTLATFILLSCIGLVVVFRGALWGNALLAPLDIGAALYSKYRWIDQRAELPRNHYLIDMFDYDLPRSYLIHKGLQQGEFPWWDPYTEGGRPLIAEPVFAASDPLRLLLFRTFPFVPAYNWGRILQSFLAGLSMFFLLRHLGFSQFATVLGGLSFQFCPLQAGLYYVVPAHSLFYYPVLWLVLHKYARSRPFLAVALGGTLCAAIIMAGTQQSHVYLVLFLGSFLLGYASCFRNDVGRLIAVSGGTFLMGCALTAPILVPQVQLFVLGDRSVPFGGVGRELLTGLFSITGLFPWFTGSFRTLDLSKLVNQTSAAYLVHIGTAATILALMGLLGGRATSAVRRPEFRMAVLLLFTYFVVVCSTPLLATLYTRASALAVPALVILCAIGLDSLEAGTWPNAARLARWVLLFLSVGVILTHVFAIAVYPRVKDKVAQVILAKDANNPNMPSVPDLRRAQIERLPGEITFKNPEALLAFLGAVATLGFAVSARRRPAFGAAVFALNLLPLIIMAHRAIPYAEIDQWKMLLKGGPEQRALLEQTGINGRLDERVRGRLDYAFPGTAGYLHGIHCLQGYSSLSLPAPNQANILYTSEAKSPVGHVSVLHTNQLRYVWANDQERNISIVKERLNSIELRIDAGPSAELVRTDTYYPGWRVESPKTLALRRRGDGLFTCVVPPEATTLILRYEPSFHRLSNLVCGVSLVGVGALFIAGVRRRPQVDAQL